MAENISAPVPDHGTIGQDSQDKPGPQAAQKPDPTLEGIIHMIKLLEILILKQWPTALDELNAQEKEPPHSTPAA